MTNIERVKKIISEQLDIDAEDISLSDHIVDDMGADSLDVVEMMMFMEEEFNIEIEDEQSEKWTTVESVSTFVTDILAR